MNDPAYYRDLINRILCESQEDDIPELPSDEELAKIKTKTLISIGKMPAWSRHITHHSVGNRVSKNIYKISVPLMNCHWSEYCWWARETVGFYTVDPTHGGPSF